MKSDVFICHASEDKATIVRPLAEALRERGLRVWYDEFTLKVGMSLHREISLGLAGTSFGILVLSPHFFRKKWPQKELDGLVSKEIADESRLLPVWHHVNADEVRSYSPPLADRVATMSSRGLERIVDDLVAVIGKDIELPEDFGERRPRTLVGKIQPTKNARRLVQEFHLRSAIDFDGDGDELFDVCSSLEDDRSRESIDFLFSIAKMPNPQAEASCGMGSLARTGEPALPEIMSLLFSDDPEQSLYMLQSLVELGNYVDITEAEAVKFFKVLVAEPRFGDVLDHLQRQCEKSEFSDEYQAEISEWLLNLREAHKMT